MGQRQWTIFVRPKRFLLLVLLFCFFIFHTVEAQSKLLADFGRTDNIELETILEQAQLDFVAGHSIDARNKLLHSFTIAPADFRPHLLLGIYYLSEVNHFQLADKYIMRAHQLFAAAWGSELDDSIKAEAHMMNSRILGLMAEAKVNLDEYDPALQIIKRFEATYEADWVATTKAWVLMKLKRIDEAIQTAQLGLMKSHNLGHVLNILGILYSLRNNSSLALQTFREAIKYEKLLGKYGQISTPLNNIGEVYREIFLDREAEAIFAQSLAASIECEHILTSLNLAILQIDELRLIQAERTLKNFETCFARFPARADTEHRALLALGYGKIALRSGKPVEAMNYFQQALARKQWFGKIGTNQNDVKLAAMIGLGQSYYGYGAVLKNKLTSGIANKLNDYLQGCYYQLKGYWRIREAQKLAFGQMDNFEDLYIRHSDAMIEYPSLGDLISSLPSASVKKRIEHLIDSETRERAKSYYQLFWATNLYSHGDNQKSLDILQQIFGSFRQFDRLASAELLRYKIKIIEAADSSAQQEVQQIVADKELLFSLSPAYFTYFNIRLPIVIKLPVTSNSDNQLIQGVTDLIFKYHFTTVKNGQNLRYSVEINDNQVSTDSPGIVIIFKENTNGKILASEVVARSANNSEISQAVDNFVNKVFIHHSDPTAEALPAVSFEEKI
ncbi:MAG: hypothetical protein IT292_12565 [Deltaproteobacteria bacterium]|nr:hypothetical protein [Deltaproteobacteria bacterium]